jgi:hypothetical protein
MDRDEEYVQLSSWAELIEWLEREGMKAGIDSATWNPKPKRRSKKKPPQSEGLF